MDASIYDFKFKINEKDIEGRKVLRDGYVHPSDVGIGSSVKRIEKDGIVKYDEKRIRVALFGLGRIGTIHLLNIINNPRLELAYCVEFCMERSNYLEFRLNLRNVKMLHPNDCDQVFADPTIDAVIIGTPTYTHEELTLRALNSGKAVLCEKPLAHDLKGMERCYKLSADTNLPLLCAFNRRFDPTFKQIHDRARKGEIGQIQVVKTCSRDCPLPSMDYIKTSGGIFHDCAVHDIDLICWIVGEYPISVYSNAHSFIDNIKQINDFDTVVIVIKFLSGAIGIIDLSRNAVYGYDQRLEVFGPKGMLTAKGIRPTDVTYHTNQGSTEVPICYSFVSRYCDSYNQELEHFADCVKGLSEVDVKAKNSFSVYKIAEAAEQSARTGKTISLALN